MSILGNRVQRFEDPELLTGAGDYVDDVTLPADAAHVVFVRSPLAYARIEAVDTSEALAAPGVLAVVTAADLDLADLEPEMMFLNPAMKRPLLARDVVRFVGEPVAAVVAETRAQAVDAAEQVIIDYDPLDAVVDPEQAREHGSTLFPDAETPLAMEIPGDLVADFDGCEVGRRAAHRQPAGVGRSHRAPRRGGLVGGRPPDHVVELPGRPPRAGQAGRRLRPRSG